ncbi:MAG: ECF transporter S component [Clostridia bacterium]|nr:ECF transporter S component [Clostridia bacterium]
MSTKTNIKKISVTAVLCALAYLCMFVFRFKVSFLTFDFKDAILAVISFIYGPVYGIVSALVVAAVELVTVSDTAFYGFIMNFISSAAFAGVCGVFYKYKRTLLGAVIGAVCAMVAMTAIMLIANVFITPLYMGVEREVVIKMIPSLLLPFNLVKGLFNAAITMIIYKPITAALKRMGLMVAGGKTQKRRFAALFVVSVIVIILATVIILYLLRGSFEFLGK